MHAPVSTRPAFALLLAVLGLAGARAGADVTTTARGNRAAIPANTVVRVRLNEELSSRTARQGERFTVTLAPDDRSGFPEGTRFEGTLTEVQRSSQDQPGILDMQFRRAILPDGRTVAIEGDLASLADEDVRRTADGRMETRAGRSDRDKKFDLKWVGYGAGAGAVLATILGGGVLKGALLGGLGGAIYGYLNRDKERDRREVRDVTLARDTEFGVRMNQRVAFADSPRYRYGRRDRVAERDGERVLGRREEFRYGSTSVMLDGRAVTFDDVRPVNLNGVLYVPLRPVARAANMRLEHFPGEDTFTLHTTAGPVQGTSTQSSYMLRTRSHELEAAPALIDGELYVPTEFLSRAADMRVDWDRRARRLELTSYRQ